VDGAGLASKPADVPVLNLVPQGGDDGLPITAVEQGSQDQQEQQQSQANDQHVPATSVSPELTPLQQLLLSINVREGWQASSVCIPTRFLLPDAADGC